MKRVSVCIRLLLAIIGLLSTSDSVRAQIERRQLDLDGEWQFRQSSASNAEWRQAEVPGDVHLDLLRNKIIQDPFNRQNESDLQWIQSAAWEYRRDVDVEASQLAAEHIDLVFEGLDSASRVSINGREVLIADNMFREWRVDVKPFLHSGRNELLVKFPSAARAAAEAAAADPWRAETRTAEKTYIRKAAFEYGWDWGPTFITSGIWRKVHLEFWGSARIADLNIHQLDITSAVARIDAEVEIESSGSTNAEVVLRHQGTGEETSETRRVELQPGLNHVTLPIEIRNPRLWFPAGYGDHPLYSFSAEVRGAGTLLDQRTVRTGLRSIVLRRDPDKWGRSFEFLVNGIPVFAKGADVIPFDSFPNRVTTANYRSILQSAVDANMNMIRHWGGGYYETDEFYSICDELGLMVWQDFMFGNDWQPGLYSWKESVEKEVKYQLKRLRNHPSIVLWCGNNETEISWNWGRTTDITKNLSAETRKRMWQDYLTTFSGIIARFVYQLTPGTPFWPSSPSADYEDLKPGQQSGDEHDWSVWHGRAPFSAYTEHYPRFMTEYGFQSFPDLRTIESFTTPADRTTIFTPVMLSHQKNDEGNALIREYLLRDYDPPKSFPDLIYMSQVLQAEGVKIGAEHLRRIRPRNMGSIYWQLNDCWPVASWSSIDYYGRWKALQYYAKRFYSPLLVSPFVEDGKLNVYVISDRPMPVHGRFRVRVLGFDGQVFFDESNDLTAAPLSSHIAFSKSLTDLLALRGLNSDQVVAVADFVADDKEQSTNLAYLVPTKQIRLPVAKINAQVSELGQGEFAVTIRSTALARSVHVWFDEIDTHLSDDYFDLLPGEEKVVKFSTGSNKTEVEKQLHTVSIASAVEAHPSTGVTASPITANPDWKP